MRKAANFERYQTPVDQATWDRFWSKVEKTDSCWLWTAGKVNGYGHFTANGGPVKAHRFLYEQTVSHVDPMLVMDHICRNPACVRPDHLRPLTSGENILIGEGATALNAKKTLCKRGHPLPTSRNRRRGRECKTCVKLLRPNRRHTEVKGYSKDGSCNRWMVKICIKGKQKFIGNFRTEAEARAAYLHAKEMKLREGGAG